MEEADTLVLEILRQDGALAMSIMEGDGLVQTVKHYSSLTVSFSEINKICREVMSIVSRASRKGALLSDYTDNIKRAGQMLWDHLLTRQVKGKLASTMIKDLILSIDEELINIPWELLYDGQDFLCLKFNLGRLVRTKEPVVVKAYRSLKSAPRMLILADPTGDLRSAYLEGLYIKNQFERKRGQIGVDFKSTRIDALYVKKNLRDYDIVHFAGHCEYDEGDPRNSGWILNDGRFTTAEVLALGESLSFPSLIFSNACYSAKAAAGTAEEDYHEKNYSLASAFLFSGVRHYIGTIWKVEDPVSLFFAKEFYAHLVKGDSVGECIRLSRLKLIKEYGIGAILWASYLLYGDPNFVLFRRKPRAVPFKFRRDISSYKRGLAGVLIALFAISAVLFLHIWLPARNPTAIFSLMRSRRLFLKGDNREVISICSGIIEKEPSFLAVYPLIADTYERLGDRGSALRYYFDYALASEKKRDKRHLSSAYIGIAWCYHQQGVRQEALDFYNKAVALSRQTRDKLNEASALRKLAVWHIDKEDYDKALELLTKSSEINRERKGSKEHAYNLACDYFDMGLVFANKDDYPAAKEFYHKSRVIFEKLNLRNELSDCYFNIGEICFFEKEYHKALDYYMRGLKIEESQGNRPGLASGYNMIGELYAQMNNFDEAERFFDRSIIISRKINARPELASACYNMGILYKNKGKKNKARDYLRQAQEIYRLTDISCYEEIKEELISLDSI
ncbi:MAG: tetratricopeptide repeat protein [Candidatus Omnitrophota bacterium]|jgi:tetratricopeptide (TPR) repeat protein/CHAT domain-containing protein